MNYKTYSPIEDLTSYVKCFWTLDSNGELITEKQRIVPDGCMEMIFHYGSPYKQHLTNGKVIFQPTCFVFGQITSSLEIEPTADTGIFAVRFYPDGFAPFSPFAISQMANRATPLKELYEEQGIKLERDILKASTTEERIKICEVFLLDRLVNPESINRIVKSSVEMILNLNGQLSVDELSGKIDVNRRQLERKFSSVIGLSPKKLSKIIRLQATLRMLVNQNFTSLTSIAYEGNYYDQAHFIKDFKDFKEFTGLSPKKFYANNLKMSALFYEQD